MSSLPRQVHTVISPWMCTPSFWIIDLIHIRHEVPFSYLKSPNTNRIVANSKTLLNQIQCDFIVEMTVIIQVIARVVKDHGVSWNPPLEYKAMKRVFNASEYLSYRKSTTIGLLSMGPK